MQIWNKIQIFCTLIMLGSSCVAARHLYSKKLIEMTFDISYYGDIQDFPHQLQQYDTHLRVLPALGIKKSLPLNIELQAANLNDLIEVISRMTSDQVTIVYNEEKDTVRLSFSNKVDVAKDAIAESLKWQQGQAPKPILQRDGVVRFPYGEYQPTVTCQPLNLCDIELQAGEEIQGVIIGDSQRWNEGDHGVPIVYSGPNNALIPHLVLKPVQGGLDTTLMVTTSKRTYMFKLKSAYNEYVARVGFYYPDETIQQYKKLNAKVAESIVPDIAMKMPLMNLAKINSKYKIIGDNYLWKPKQVFDDGTSVYIQMPLEVNSRDLPGVCVLAEEGNDEECEMVNFRYLENFYVIDKLFDRAKLINGFDDNIQTITIEHTKDSGFWSRMWG